MYYYYRRIPSEFEHLDKRTFIRLSLKTDSRKEAERLSTLLSNEIEDVWKGHAERKQTIDGDEYKSILKRAKNLNIEYKPMHDLLAGDVVNLIHRILNLQSTGITRENAEVLLGRHEKPSILLSEVIDKYWEFAKDKLLNKSPNQKKQFIIEREHNMKLFAKVVGNKRLIDLSRDDIIKFRNHWIKRMQNENLSPFTPNKSITQVKVILDIVVTNLSLDIDLDRLFKKVKFKQVEKQNRLPFETDFIKRKLLSPKFMNALGKEEKGVLMVMAELGCRISEITGLKKEDIFLNEPIPYIYIRPRATKSLKNIQSERKLPLIGYALDAMKENPEGFKKLYDNNSTFSIMFNRYMRQSFPDLPPTQTMYSLRHSFQDRILSVNAPDRIQAELMGHKFNRPKYGDGGSLEQKLEWLKKIQLKDEKRSK